MEIICSSKLTVFLELRSRKTARFEGQLMSAHKFEFRNLFEILTDFNRSKTKRRYPTVRRKWMERITERQTTFREMLLSHQPTFSVPCIGARRCHASTCYVTWPKSASTTDFLMVELDLWFLKMNCYGIRLMLGVSRSHFVRGKSIFLNVYSLRILKEVTVCMTRSRY